MTTTILKTKISEDESKIADTSGLAIAIVLITKISAVENEIPVRVKYFTTQYFNNLTAENFDPRLKQANLVTKTDFDNKLISSNRKITSNKTKYFGVRKKLNSLTTKDYNFFLGRIFYTSNDGSQNMFVYQPTFDTLELKKDKGTEFGLS